MGVRMIGAKRTNRTGMACIAAIAGLALLTSCGPAPEATADKAPEATADKAPEPGAPSITHGMAEMTDAHVFDCVIDKWRVTAVGRITASDGTEWTVPADVAYKTAAKATDLYNDCNEVFLGGFGEFDIDTVPVVEIDADGEVITAIMFADNYFELYVNGTLIAVDPVPYWPFNVAIVRFRAKRPFTAAYKLVDWEENLGIGSEMMLGVPYYQGDGGLAAVFRDQAGETIALTGSSWRAQTYYTGPLIDPGCLTLAGGARLSGDCEMPAAGNADDVYAAHWPVPLNWAEPGFDDSGWPAAIEYSNEQIGGSLQRPAFENFSDIFDNPAADAQFIWTSSLLLDNLVLARKRIE